MQIEKVDSKSRRSRQILLISTLCIRLKPPRGLSFMSILTKQLNFDGSALFELHSSGAWTTVPVCWFQLGH
jgi:hypothetical protein